MGEEGISCEVIDVASIKPLDIETILASVEKTGRCVIVHEGAKTCGVGAEISALIMENVMATYSPRFKGSPVMMCHALFSIGKALYPER